MQGRWSALINTPLQRGDRRPQSIRNRFNGFGGVRETVETVPDFPAPRSTPLKRGVNESGAATNLSFGEQILSSASLFELCVITRVGRPGLSPEMLSLPASLRPELEAARVAPRHFGL
jgi:hypothetical protein